MVMFFTRLAFRGIYFPQMNKWHWFLVLWKNRSNFVQIMGEAIKAHRQHQRNQSKVEPTARLSPHVSDVK